MRLAHEIVSVYHSEAEADRAQEEFVRVFQQGDLPEELPEYRLQPGQSVLDVLEASELVSSRSEGRRLINQNGVRLDGEVLSNPNQAFPHPGVLQAGKRRFRRIIT
jgi:tyrosyl-tRNA synthetase